MPVKKVCYQIHTGERRPKNIMRNLRINGEQRRAQQKEKNGFIKWCGPALMGKFIANVISDNIFLHG